MRCCLIILSPLLALAGCADEPLAKYDEREARLESAFAANADEFASPPV